MSAAKVVDVAPTRSPAKPCCATFVHAGVSRSQEGIICAFLFVFAFLPAFYHLQQAPSLEKMQLAMRATSSPHFLTFSLSLSTSGGVSDSCVAVGGFLNNITRRNA